MEIISLNWILPTILTITITLTVYFGYRFFKLTKRHRIQAQKLDLVINQYEYEQKNTSKLSAELADMQTQLDHSLAIDPITKLPSRMVFEDRLQQTINQSKRYDLIFAVMALEIDSFRIMENILGPNITEQLLKEMTVRLQACIRSVDTLSRTTGDEFMFLLTQVTKPEMVAFISQRIIDVVSEPFNIEGQELFVTVCIGISIFPVDGDDNKLFKHAQTALHQAKARGTNVYQFYQKEMHTTSRREILLNCRLRSDTIYDELALFYQPIVNVETKRIVSMEALLRWHHPDFGLITAREFLKLAENNGRIVPIGEWVVRKALMQFKVWQERGFNPQKISINVSLRQLEHQQFVHHVSRILKETEVQPENVVFEISESTLYPNIDVIEKNLLMLRHLGVQIAIDDFGTGYLSLQHLRRFPVDYIKIDGTLIKDMTVDDDTAQIVKMIIALANSLHLGIIAEAVESPKQKQALQDLGCVMMQGHLFASPHPAKEYDKESHTTMIKGITNL